MRTFTTATAAVMLFALATPPPVSAQTDAAAGDGDGVAAFNHFFREVKTFDAEFSQVVLDEDLNPLEDGSGHVRIKRPGKFRWDYIPPDAQEIVGDGEKIWLHDVELEQVIVRGQAEALGRTPAILLAGGGDLESAYKVESIGTHAAVSWVNLIPTDAESGFTEVRLGFEAQRLRQMELVDTLDRHTRISFFEIKENEPLDDKWFTFTPPPGADVIDQTGE